MEPMRSRFVVIALALLACNDPYKKVIPATVNDWDSTEFKQAVQKLPDQDQKLLAMYLFRHKLGSVLGKEADVPTGATIRQAIDEQKKFAQEEDRREVEQKALAAKAKAEREAQQKQLFEAATVAVDSLVFREHNWERDRSFSDSFIIHVVVQNKTDRAIAGVKGALHFADVFGDEIMTSNLSLDRSIAANSTIQWTGSIDYNQFNDSHKKLRSTAFGKMKIRWDPSQVVFEDGARLAVPD
jgi:uncharacterized protein YaiL (DUF2058 family)